MTSEQRYRLRRMILVFTYLTQQGWKPTAYSESDEVCGPCPLHRDSRPSFYVNRRKNVFYCHGCGQGGDGDPTGGTTARGGLPCVALESLIREDDADRKHLWSDACDFYQHQLQSNLDAQCYLGAAAVLRPGRLWRRCASAMRPAAACESLS